MDQSYESRWSLYSGNSISTEDLNWSLQPNYLKMMSDTNLIDSCAAAREELESVRARMSMKQTRKHFQFLETNNFKTQRTLVDAEQLEQWIVYMDKYLKAFAPNWNQVVEMDSIQRNISFDEQCKLRQYIASHNKIFSQMVREEDSSRTRKVHHMYHMLLLNAIEKQCLLEENLRPEDNLKSETFDGPNIELDQINKMDSGPQHNLDLTLKRSTESLDVHSDSWTTVPSDDGIHFATYPTTSKSSSFSEDQCSPFSSHPDLEHDEDYHSWESIMQELNNITIDTFTEQSSIGLLAKNPFISESSLELIKNVDHVLSIKPNEDDLLKNKIDSWLLNHYTGVDTKSDPNTDTATSESDLDSTISIQWDNFQDIYTSTTPMHEDTPSKAFLFFGDNYDEVLKCKDSSSSASISDRSATPEILSIESKICVKDGNQTVDETILSSDTECESCDKMKNQVVQADIPNNNSQVAEDILLLIENLQNNYMKIRPRDFDGLLKICRENLGCLLVVLDKNHSHYNSKDSMINIDDDKSHVSETCQCGIISCILARIVKFLHGSSRRVRKSAMFKFLFNVLKKLYSMVRFVSHQVRVYRILYDHLI